MHCLEAHRLRLRDEVREDVRLRAVGLRAVRERPDLEVVAGADENDVRLDAGVGEERVLGADAVLRVDGKAADQLADAAREPGLDGIGQRGAAEALHALVEFGGAEHVQAPRARKRRHHVDLRGPPHALVPIRRNREAALRIQTMVRPPENRLDLGFFAVFRDLWMGCF